MTVGIAAIFDLLRAEGTGKQIALQDVTAGHAEEYALLFCLHPLAYDLKPEGTPERYDRVNDRAGSRVAR